MFLGKIEVVVLLSEGMWKEMILVELVMLYVVFLVVYWEESFRKCIGGILKVVWYEICVICFFSDKLGFEGGCVDDGILGVVFILVCIEVSFFCIYEYDS